MLSAPFSHPPALRCWQQKDCQLHGSEHLTQPFLLITTILNISEWFVFFLAALAQVIYMPLQSSLRIFGGYWQSGNTVRGLASLHERCNTK